MDQKILDLAAAEDGQGLLQLLQHMKEQEVGALITRYALKGKETGMLMRAIFKGSPCVSKEGVCLRLFVYKHCMQLVESGDLQSDVATDMIGLLMLEAHQLPGTALAELASLYVDAIKGGSIINGKSLDLFPTILTVLASQESLNYGGGHLNGEEYKKQLINTLCSSRQVATCLTNLKWDPKCVIHLTSMFRDVPLSIEELQFVMMKVLRMFPKLELQELPPLVYQLLLLSAKGCKKTLLEGIVTFFHQQDQLQKEEQTGTESMELEAVTVPQDQLYHVEGTVILHIVFAIKLDHDLGRELIKYLKAGQQGDTGRVLCSFNIALMLSVARIHRFEEQGEMFLRALGDISCSPNLLSDIVISAPLILLDSSSKVIEAFDHLSYLPLSTVQGLLKAVQ
eukprot:g46995.t1